LPEKKVLVNISRKPVRLFTCNLQVCVTNKISPRDVLQFTHTIHIAVYKLYRVLDIQNTPGRDISSYRPILSLWFSCLMILYIVYSYADVYNVSVRIEVILLESLWSQKMTYWTSRLNAYHDNTVEYTVIVACIHYVNYIPTASIS